MTLAARTLLIWPNPEVFTVLPASPPVGPIEGVLGFCAQAKTRRFSHVKVLDQRKVFRANPQCYALGWTREFPNVKAGANS